MKAHHNLSIGTTMNRIFRLGVASLAALVLLSLNACTTVGPDYHVPPDAVISTPAAAGNFKEGNETS